MSRKDYVALAADLAIDYKNCLSSDQLNTFEAVLFSICVALKRDNSNFDREKFVAAVKG